MTALAILSLLCAAFPAVLFLRNLRVFLSPARAANSADDVSILIPARDEERNIQAAIKAALANTGAEVLVLDDGSTDGTRQIVEREPRVRLLRGGPISNDWCGKNWACAQLATAATRSIFLFVDADVRLDPQAAASISNWMRENDAQLASGVPRQELGGFIERLLIPLIHFVLLGFLPLQRMRRSRHPAYATGCGQLMIAEAEAYRAVGGHGAIRSRMHDGLALPRVFREQGFRTDLFDATSLATCRMYRSGIEAWRGLSKNTHEGLGAPARILPVTIILMAGQVLPFVLLAINPRLTAPLFSCALLGAILALLARLAAAIRFHQPLATVLLHPIAIGALLVIQWIGLARFILRKPAKWKSREYLPLGNESRLAGDGVTLTDTREQIPERVQDTIDGCFH